MRVTISRTAPQKLDAEIHLLPDEASEIDKTIERLNGKPFVLYFNEGPDGVYSTKAEMAEVSKLAWRTFWFACAIAAGLMLHEWLQ